MLDLQKTMWRAFDFTHDHPSAAYAKSKAHHISQLLPRWKAKRDIAAGDAYRRQGFSDLYGRSHGLRKGTFDGFDMAHENLGKQRVELYGLATETGLSQEELAIKSKTYKKQAKEFCGMVKGRTKGISPRPIDFNNLYSFLTPPSSAASDRSFSPPPNVTVNVACGSVSSHTGCTSPTCTEFTIDREDRPADNVKVNNGHTRTSSYAYKRGQPFLTVNVTSPPPGLSPSLTASSVPDSPETGCRSCPPTPVASQFDKSEVRLPGFDHADDLSGEKLGKTAKRTDTVIVPANPFAYQVPQVDTETAAVPLPVYGYLPPGFVPFSSPQVDATAQFPEPSSIYQTTTPYWPPIPSTPPPMHRDNVVAQGNLLGLVNLQAPQHETTRIAAAVGTQDASRQLAPLPPMSPGEHLHRANLIEWIRSYVPDAINVSRRKILQNLSTDALTHIMVACHNEGADACIRLIEHYSSDSEDGHLDRLSQGLNCTFSCSRSVQQIPADDEVVLTWPPAPVLRNRSLESEQSVQPFRRLTNDSDLSTLLFNGNNSPIPRNALGPLPTWREAADYIQMHLNPVQEELAKNMLDSIDADQVVRIAKVFRDQGAEAGIADLDVVWNAWMNGFRKFGDPRLAPSPSATSSNDSYPEWFSDSPPLYGLPLTTSPMGVPATLPSEYSQDPVQPTRNLQATQGTALFEADTVDPDYARFLGMPGRAEAISHWVHSVQQHTNNDSAPAPQEYERPSSCMLDYVERGGQRELEASSVAFSAVTAGHGHVYGNERETSPLWSLPGLQGLPMRLANHTRIWGF